MRFRAPCPPSAVPALIWLVGAIVLPIGAFFLYGFWTSDLFGISKDWNLDQYARVFEDAFYLKLIAKTVALALVVATMAVIVGYGAAYAISFKLRRWQSAALFLVIAVAFASFLVRIYAWLVILGPEGPINRGLAEVGAIGAPLGFLLYTPFSVVVTLVSILVPFATLAIYSSMQGVDRDVLTAGRDLGGGPIVSFVRVLAPLTWPGIVVGFVLTFILAMGDYVTPQLVGGKSGLMVGRVIFDQFGTTQDWSFASALSFVSIGAAALTLLGLWALTRALRRVRVLARPRTARPLLPARLGRRLRAIPWSRIYLTAFAVFVASPLALVIAFSFSDGQFAAFPINGLTLDWYSEAFRSPEFRTALGTSILVAAIATGIAMAVGIPAAFALARSRFRLRGTLAVLVILPLAVPGVVLGLALLTGLQLIGVEVSRTTAVVAQATLALPLVVLIAAARVRALDPDLEDAGRDLGCTRAGVIRRVVAPAMAPTLVGVCLLAFAASMDEFVVTNLVVGADRTLPVHIWGLFQRQGISPVVNSIATMMVVGSALILLVLATVGRTRERVVAGLTGESAGRP